MSSDPETVVKQITNNNKQILRGFVAMLSKAPKGQLGEQFKTECQNLGQDEDPVFFLRNLRDKLVHVGGCSDFVIKSISVGLGYFPEESSEEAALRKANLSQNMAEQLQNPPSTDK